MAQQQLDDVIMPVAGGLVQQGLAVSVPNIEFCTTVNKDLGSFLQTASNG
jgi:hypothetical protein